MRLLGQIILVCVIVSALQGLVAVLAIAIVLFILWGLLFRTAETIGLLVMLGLMAALQSHPWITIGAGLALGGVLLIAGKMNPSERDEPPVDLLPPPDAD